MDFGWVKDELKSYAKQAEQIIIAPMGRWGGICKKILEEDIKFKNIVCLDNYKYDNHIVYPVEEIIHYPGALCLITAENEEIRQTMKKQLEGHIKDIRIVELFSDALVHKWSNLYGRVHLDFLCCGFAKCGSTSLQGALCLNPNVFLPDIKETFFAGEMFFPEAHKNFCHSYPSDLTKGKVVGGIEPSYLNCAKAVRDYFGSELKILFCVRNPVEAAHSLFRMHMRDSVNDKVIYYLKKYKKISPAVFDEWIEGEDAKNIFLYMDYIKEYMKYYPKNQIKVVVFEELARSPVDLMNEIQQYIGLDEEQMIVYDEFPHENIGTCVPKDLAGAYVNKSIMQLVLDTKDPDLRISLIGLRSLIGEITNEEYHQEMLEDTRNKLMDFYIDSIHELEKFTGKSLKGIWYS